MKIFSLMMVLALLGTLAVSDVAAQQYYGQKITAEKAIKPAALLKTMENKDSVDVKLEAKIAVVCQKKGCWMDLDLENGQTMKVRFKDYEFFVPKDAAGKTAIIEGRAKREVTDVKTLRHYAEDAGKSEADVAAITEPETSYTFEAVGVIIK